MKPMFCPECQKTKTTSKVFIPMGGISTDMAWQPYYDEKGFYHSHNPNKMTQEWSCSNGHAWRSVTQNQCPNCDYGGVRKRYANREKTT